MSSSQRPRDPAARLALSFTLCPEGTQTGGKGPGSPLRTARGLSRPVKLPQRREAELISSNTLSYAKRKSLWEVRFDSRGGRAGIDMQSRAAVAGPPAVNSTQLR